MADYGSNNVIISETLYVATYTDMTPPILYKGFVYYDPENLLKSVYYSTESNTTTLYQTGQIYPTLTGDKL